VGEIKKVAKKPEKRRLKSCPKGEQSKGKGKGTSGNPDWVARLFKKKKACRRPEGKSINRKGRGESWPEKQGWGQNGGKEGEERALPQNMRSTRGGSWIDFAFTEKTEGTPAIA